MTTLTRVYLTLILLLMAACGWVLLDARRTSGPLAVWPDRPAPARSSTYMDGPGPATLEEAEVFHPGLPPMPSLDDAHGR